MTRSTVEVIDGAEVAVLPSLGHEAIDAAPTWWSATSLGSSTDLR